MEVNKQRINYFNSGIIGEKKPQTFGEEQEEMATLQLQDENEIKDKFVSLSGEGRQKLHIEWKDRQGEEEREGQRRGRQRCGQYRGVRLGRNLD